MIVLCTYFPLLFYMHVPSHRPVLVPRNTRFGLCSVDLHGRMELESCAYFVTGREKPCLLGFTGTRLQAGLNAFNRLTCMIPGLKQVYVTYVYIYIYLLIYLFDIYCSIAPVFATVLLEGLRAISLPTNLSVVGKRSWSPLNHRICQCH